MFPALFLLGCFALGCLYRPALRWLDRHERAVFRWVGVGLSVLMWLAGAAVLVIVVIAADLWWLGAVFLLFLFFVMVRRNGEKTERENARRIVKALESR